MWKWIVKHILQNPKVADLIVSFMESYKDGEFSTKDRETIINDFIEFVAEKIKELL